MRENKVCLPENLINRPQYFFQPSYKPINRWHFLTETQQSIVNRHYYIDLFFELFEFFELFQQKCIDRVVDGFRRIENQFIGMLRFKKKPII